MKESIGASVFFQSEKSSIFLIEKHARPQETHSGDFRAKRERASIKAAFI
ncbi:MAG: hypothetical protein U5L45_19700 [Saprospiraceae bacterium]|nr:hypothetical protein [Saprospiraceae bacterium]